MKAVFILVLCGTIFAATPVAVDDLHLTAAGTSRICYPLVNDTDADHDEAYGKGGHFPTVGIAFSISTASRRLPA